MKKKAIEKIPYLTVAKACSQKTVKYIGVTAWKNIGGERHIFLEVYRNSKKSLQVPVVRYVATKKDWGVYFPENDVWTRQKIETNDWHNGMCWEDRNDNEGSYKEREKRNILYSSEDLDRIKKYFSKITIWREASWWEYFERNEKNINYDKERRKYERRQQALKERCDSIGDLPEQEILKYASTYIFHNKHFLYYKKNGRKAHICCSACEQMTSGAWKSGISYESNFERHIEEPVEGRMGRCPRCGAVGRYKPSGKAKTVYEEKGHIFLGEKYKENGFVLRYIDVFKGYQLEMTAGDKGPEMYAAHENLMGIEIARAYFEQGKNVQIDYNKHNPYSGKDFWDDCNLSGLSNITISDGLIMPETFDNLEGTYLKYCALREYCMAAGVERNPITYLKRYIEIPQIEMLVKFKLNGLVNNLLHYAEGIIKNKNAKRLDEFIGIRKERIKLLMAGNEDYKLLKVLQMESAMNQTWTEAQIMALKEIRADARQIEVVLQCMTVQKALNRIAKYAGCEYGTGCSRAEARLVRTAEVYFDYLSMRRNLGYNLENTVYQQPRNLQQAHDEMVTEQNKDEQDKRLNEVAEQYPLIRKNYRGLRNRYFYEDEVYIIRPARSAEEIVIEGRTLHHCVGGNNYLDKHNKKESIILMLRFKDLPEMPYVTVEIKGEKIVQWYGAHDKKPDEKNLQRWLDAYTTRLKCQRLGVAERTENEVMQQMLAYA